jgi:3-(3-hydroxy-phenyl)propionate hydroxylase
VGSEGVAVIARGAVDHDVVVIGFGPAGSTLAALLARRGLRVLVAERDHDIYPLPRAVHFDHEIMRTLQEVGIADELSADTIVNPGMDFITGDKDVLLSMRPDPVTASGWPASMFFFQPHLERRIRDRAEVLGAQIRLGARVDDVVDHGTHVEVRFADGGTTTAYYAVGCDGARSTVRRCVGIEMDDLQFEEPWLVVDLVLRDGTPQPADLALQVCDPVRPTTLVPMPPPRFRFEFMLLQGDDPEAISSPESVGALLSPWMNPADAAVERSAVYTFHGLIAHTWRAGRVLLAGDAAHMTPPFLGQGMCAGIRDAANLAWKLDRVVRETSPDALLDTYGAEREPHVREFVEAAVNFGRLICTTDRAVAAQRDHDMLAARAAGGGQVGSAGSPRLVDGPLVESSGGTPAPQPILDGVRLDDVVGQRFAIVVRDVALIDEDAASWWASNDAVVLDATQHIRLGEMLDAVGVDALVLRPDRYAFAGGDRVRLPGVAATTLLTPAGPGPSGLLVVDRAAISW